MKQEILDERCAAFAEDLEKIKEKHQVTDIICLNWDNKEMGYVQLHKMIKNEEEGGFVFVVSFSGKSESLCLRCNGEKKCH